MFAPQLIFDAIKDSLAQNVEVAFRQFVTRNHLTKWMIAADFVTSGEERVNDALAFSVVPYDDDLHSIFDEIQAASPSDLKHIKSVNGRMLQLLADQRRFHFCFVPNRDRHRLFSLQDAREAIAESIRMVEGWTKNPSQPHYLRKFRALEQAAKAKGFKHRLLHDTVLMAALAAIIAFLIAKHSRPERIGWFVDRDNMTTAFDGWAHDAMWCNFSSLCEAEGVDGSRVALSFAIPGDAAVGKAAWYDDLVRLPDFIAGTVARWHISNNAFQVPADKFVQVAERVVAENPHVVVMPITFDLLGVRASVIRTFRTSDTNLAAYDNDAAARLELAIFETSRHVQARLGSRRERLLGTSGLTLVPVDLRPL